jgi:hypothetical protein
MKKATSLAAAQLGRMRGMTAMYHRRFFFDVNLTSVSVVVLLLVGWWRIEEAFLLVPVVALMGAVATAFDASYLMFARWYAAYLERYLDDAAGERVLVAAELEDTYLFPLGTPKVVTIPIGGSFTWFSFVTVFYTVVGVAAYAFGIILGWGAMASAPIPVVVLYLVVLIGLTVAAVIMGLWWFASGEGERRLAEVLDRRFATTVEPSDTAG